MIEQMRRLQTGCALTPQQQCTQHLYKSIWNLRASSDLDYTRCLESLYVGFWFSVLFCFFNVLGFFQNQRLLQLFWENAASPFCCEAPEILFYKLRNYAWLPSSWVWVDDYWTLLFGWTSPIICLHTLNSPYRWLLIPSPVSQSFSSDLDHTMWSHQCDGHWLCTSSYPLT